MSKQNRKQELGVEAEDLDLASFGLYIEKDPNVPEEDFFLTPYIISNYKLWARHSETSQNTKVSVSGTTKKTKKRTKK